MSFFLFLLLCLLAPSPSQAAVTRFPNAPAGWSSALRPLSARLPWIKPSGYPALVRYLNIPLRDFTSAPELMVERLEAARADFQKAEQPNAAQFMTHELKRVEDPQVYLDFEYLARFHAPLMTHDLAAQILAAYAEVSASKGQARLAKAKAAINQFSENQTEWSFEMNSQPMKSALDAEKKAKKGGPLMAIIDMGSNNFKLMFGRVVDGEYDEPFIEKKKLGAGDNLSQHGQFTPEKLAEMRETLAYFKEKSLKKKLLPSAVATAAFRESPNTSEVVKIAQELGIPIEIASEQRESELAYMSATMGAPKKAVIDLGSRTIEMVVKNKDGYAWRVYQLGYRISYERFFKNAKTFTEAAAIYLAELKRQIPEMDFMQGKEELLGIEFTEMAKFMRGDSDEPLDGIKLKAKKIRKELARLYKMTAKQFEKLRREKEIDEVLPRLVYLDYMFKLTGYESITIMDRELGAGLIAEAAAKP